MLQKSSSFQVTKLNACTTVSVQSLVKIEIHGLVREANRRYKSRVGQDEARICQAGLTGLEDMPPEFHAPFLDTLKRYFPEQQWGWVAFRTCCYEDEQRWSLFIVRFNMIVNREFRQFEHVPGVAEAKKLSIICWVRDTDLEGADNDQVARHYRALLRHGAAGGELSPGLRQHLCLSVNPASVASVLDSPLNTPVPVLEQLLIPFVLTVNQSAGEDLGPDADVSEGLSHRSAFKVSVDSLVCEPFHTTAGDIMDTRELSLATREDQVWCNGSGRFGLFTIGVSQTDGRS